MSRHLRRIERSRKANERRQYAQPLRMLLGAEHGEGDVSTWHASRLMWVPNEPATITNLDADHAVAREREAIAQMVSRRGDLARDNPFQSHVEANRLWNLAEDIRNGDHHANTPPAAQEQGWDAR